MYGKCFKILKHLLPVKRTRTNSTDPDQTASEEVVRSGSHLFAILMSVLLIPALITNILPENGKRKVLKNFEHLLYFSLLTVTCRPPDKSACWNIIFFISHPKHMLWVLKRTVSMRWFF